MSHLLNAIFDELKSYDIQLINDNNNDTNSSCGKMLLEFHTITKSIKINNLELRTYKLDNIEYYIIQSNLSILKIIEIIMTILANDFLNKTNNTCTNEFLRIYINRNYFISIELVENSDVIKFMNNLINLNSSIDLNNLAFSNDKIIVYSNPNDIKSYVNSAIKKYGNCGNLKILYQI